MTPLRTLIVDDEALALQRLRRLLASFPDRLIVVGEAANGTDALRQIQTLDPQLLFLDIQMPGKSGLEIARGCPPTLPIIFVTAYDAFALQAFEANAVDYLLKPVSEKRLTQALDKLSRATHGLADPARLERLLGQLAERHRPEPPKRLVVRKGDSVRFIALEQVLYFKAADKYTFAVTQWGEEIINHSLGELESMLAGGAFQRIHRGHIINMEHLKELRKWFGGRYLAIMDDPKQTELPVSRKYVKEILP